MARNLTQPETATYTSTTESEFLGLHDGYIKNLVRKYIPRNRFLAGELEAEIDEVAQRVRLKLWKTLQKEVITNPKSYIGKVVHSVIVDWVRQHRPTFPLIIDEEGELYIGNLLINYSAEMQDPALKFERQERILVSIDIVAKAVAILPYHQQYAILCTLKDQLDDLIPLLNAFKKLNIDIDIEKINWPEEKGELQSLRSSRSIAQRKLRALLRDVNLFD